MAKPVILAVDDDPEVLRAVERDLRRQYGSQYRVLRAGSGTAALDTLRQLTQRADPVALLLADQRMPHMTGVGFLAQARELYPQAKRALLTAYADTDAAIQAINQVQIDYYLLKPWDPPEQTLYPILDDLLEDWQASYRPAFEGMRLLGHRWSPQTHALKDFLTRSRVPYRWLDIETRDTDPEVETVLQALGGDPSVLPIALLPDGTNLPDPAIGDLAEKIGLKTQPDQETYDLVIVGGGPAGLAAAVYGASEGLKTLMIERGAPGGQAGTSTKIENYLGFPSGISGDDLARRAVIQATRFGVEILAPQEVTGVRLEGAQRILTLTGGKEVSCHALLIATGVSWRKLDVPGIDALTNAGVYYGAAQTEALSCRDDDVFVVGGANSAGQAAMAFARVARSVIMLVRGAGLSATMSHYLIEQIGKTENITVRPHSQVTEAQGEGHLECLRIANTETGETETVPASALFIFIGAVPHTDWLEGVVARDAQGFILSGPELMERGKRPKGWPLERDPMLLETSVPGIFVAGDARNGSVKRVSAGVGEGGVAVSLIHQYLSKL